MMIYTMRIEWFWIEKQWATLQNKHRLVIYRCWWFVPFFSFSFCTFPSKMSHSNVPSDTKMVFHFRFERTLSVLCFGCGSQFQMKLIWGDVIVSMGARLIHSNVNYWIVLKWAKKDQLKWFGWTSKRFALEITLTWIGWLWQLVEWEWKACIYCQQVVPTRNQIVHMLFQSYILRPQLMQTGQQWRNWK